MEDKMRQTWGSQFEFLLACIGSAVGLGNAWRFPYLCYENGGGAFLLPYIIMFFLCGLPLFFMEICLGQFAGHGPLTIWNFCPLFKGIGIGVMMITTFLYIYYNVIISWTIYFAVKSLSFPHLPWTTCDNEWNTPYCFDDLFNTTQELGNTETSVRASEEFWIHKVHDLPSTMREIGGMNWHLLGCLCLSWFAVYLCVVKGIKSLGKVVYVTALLPYVFLTILVVKGITLPGAWEGIKFYIVPKFEDLLAIKPWRDAASQICFSLGISLGTKMTLASYNDFHNNCFRDTIYVVTINCATSVFAGFAIFSVLGFMANESNQELADVVDSGIGLAFIAYPEALARMPGSQIWSFFFFIMLFTLGVDSEFILVETIITAIMDSLPSKLKYWRSRVTIAVCFVGFLLSCVMVTKVFPDSVMTSK
ncbi:sodium- and chloride-dependent glycine transporter 1-like [Apostichopus japonicus]|uniref:sodium- and chloride-dependent glycine transporter 1-like n=1 Tax=Stichopus japonicus TaxID=307972 RepID=UPI003AB65AA9